MLFSKSAQVLFFEDLCYFVFVVIIYNTDAGGGLYRNLSTASHVVFLSTFYNVCLC